MMEAPNDRNCLVETRELEGRTAAQAAALPPSLRRLVLALILGATFVVYVGTLGFDFVNDDHDQIIRNFYVHAWRYAPRYFTGSFWNSVNPNALDNYYRPVCLLLERTGFQLFGENPRGWHTSAVLLHVLVTLLVYLLGQRLLADRFAAGVAALIFGLHPAHVEAVAWISGASESLGTALLIAAFLAYLRSRDRPVNRRRWFGASCGLFAVGLLSKETVVVFPLLVVAYELILTKQEAAGEKAKRGRAIATRIAPYIALVLIYFVARRHVLGGLGLVLTPLSATSLLISLPSVGWFYLRHLLWPVNLSPYYDLAPIASPTLRNFILPLAALLATGLALAAGCRRSRAALFAVAWTILSLAPVLDIQVFKAGHMVHDRYLYLPSVGFALLAALAVRRLRAGGARIAGEPAIQVVLVGGIALAFAVGTVSQSLWWANDLLHAERSVAVAPGNLDAWHNLAAEVAARGNSARAMEIYDQVLSRNPNYWPSAYNLGTLCYRLGRMQEAQRSLRRAAQIDPGDPRAFAALAAVDMQTGRLDEAVNLLRHALALSPDAVGYHLALGRIFKSQGNSSAALEEFRTEITQHPENAAARKEIADLDGAREQGSSPASPARTTP